MASSMTSRVVAKPCQGLFGKVAGMVPSRPTRARGTITVRAAKDEAKQVIQPMNGDPFIGMLETPVTSAPIVASFLSNLPAYRTGVAPLLRGVEIGLTHGFFVAGPFIKLGPLRDVEGQAEIAGCLAAALLVVILTGCLTIYGQATFQEEEEPLGIKTLSGRDIQRDPLQTADGWNEFSAGFFVGGLSGVAWAYLCTIFLPFYS